MNNRINKLNNLQQRVISGVIGAAIIIAAIIFSQWSFFFIFLVVAVAAQVEFYNLVKQEVAKPNILLGLLIGVINYGLFFHTLKSGSDFRWFILNFPLISLIFISELYTRKTNPFTNISFTLLGILYVSMPFSLLLLCVYFQGTYNWQIVVGIIMFLWLNDTGAYISGRLFGKRKLFERISPKKTWEGSIGGLIFAVGGSLIIGHYFPVLPQQKWTVCSVIIVVLGTYGDLIESLFKRSIDIKDSGSIIPGHGGFLDRFDSLIISTPFIAAYLMLF